MTTAAGTMRLARPRRKQVLADRIVLTPLCSNKEVAAEAGVAAEPIWGQKQLVRVQVMVI